MLKIYFSKALSLFFIAGFIFIPLTFPGLDDQYRLTRFFFLKPVTFIQGHFFWQAIANIDFSSDTTGLNILLCLLFMLSFLLTWLINLFKVRSSWIIPLFKSLSAYYIALILLKYGFDKIFKQQFQLPEPNLLYADFGSLTKDILFWSTIGLSHTYSLVTGTIEVVTAILILIKRTRTFGFCLSAAILINILLINFSFDISVKTFTAFLLAVSASNIYPYLDPIYSFFIKHKQVQLKPIHQQATPSGRWISALLAVSLICYTMFPYLSSGNFNDDHAGRPLLHGAYRVTHFIIGNDTLNQADFPYKRIFIHRNSYLIFQQGDDQMIDYFFEINPVKKQLELQDYQKNKIMINYDYDEKNGVLRLRFNNRERWVIESKSLNWQALPALQDKTHYTIDDIR